GKTSCNNNLVHGTVVCAVAKITDGYNTKEPTACLTMNKVPSPKEPSCSVSATPGPYGGATVKWSSNGTLNRSSVTSRTSGGYYDATATRKNTDGLNVSTQSRTCGMTINKRPTPWGQPSTSVLCGNGSTAQSRAKNLIQGTYSNAEISWEGWSVSYISGGSAGQSSWGGGIVSQGGTCRGIQSFQAYVWKVSGPPLSPAATNRQLSAGSACPSDLRSAPHCSKFNVGNNSGALNQNGALQTWDAAKWYAWAK
ncbi:MAG: hypothetical protein LBH13_06355, partial [Cellulomonadaceae bacterium]|nr:hypothetical protein [Cellulomonadaceae bacterium]